MIVRIDKCFPEGEGVHVEASLVDDTDPVNPITLASISEHFDTDTTQVAALVQIQRSLAVEMDRLKRLQKLMSWFPEGQTFPPKTEKETKAFLGL